MSWDVRGELIRVAEESCRLDRLALSSYIIYFYRYFGKTTDEKNAISRAIHEASVKAGNPEDDMAQRFLCLEPPDLKVDLNYPGLPKPRTEQMLMIEVLVSSGTDADRKTRLLAALVEALDGAGTDPNDVMVFFGEIDRANSSFGDGRLAPPVSRI